MTFIRRAALAAALGVGLGATAAEAGQELTVTHYGSLLYGLPIAIADERGWFAEEGVTVDGVLTAPGGGTAVRNALASDLPVGESGLPAVIAARASGLDLVIIYSAISSVADASWVVAKDSPIETVADLEGRTATYTNPKSGSETQLKTVLQSAGLEGKVNLVASGGMREGLTMVEGGSADAAPVVEPMRTMFADKFRRVFDVADHRPPAVQIVGFTTREFADANPDVVKAIVAARARGVDAINEDPAAAAKAGATAYERVPPAVLEEVIRTLAADGYWSRGEFDMDAFAAAEEELIATGVVSEPVEWPAILDDRFLPDAE